MSGDNNARRISCLLAIISGHVAITLMSHFFLFQTPHPTPHTTIQFITALLTQKHTVLWLKLTEKRYNIIYINESFIEGGFQSTVYQSDIAVSLSLFICVKKS